MNRKPVLARVALVDQVTAFLMERVLDRVYVPGEKLNIDALSREFEVSSSPIREALTQEHIRACSGPGRGSRDGLFIG